MKLIKFFVIYLIVSSGIAMFAVSDFKQMFNQVAAIHVVFVAIILFLVFFIRRKVGRKRRF